MKSKKKVNWLIYINYYTLKNKNKVKKQKKPHQFLGNISHMAGKGMGERNSKLLEVI